MSMNSSKLGSIPEQFRLSYYDYKLPPALIAQDPCPARDGSKLLVIDKQHDSFYHSEFHQIANYLMPGDVIVVNETKVVKALIPCRKPTGAHIELLIVDPLREYHGKTGFTERVCITKTSKGIRPGSVLHLSDGQSIKIIELLGKGRILVEFPESEDRFHSFLDHYGQMPLPPYVDAKKENESRDIARYQTVYSTESGSIAAPTAGLHFTNELINDLSTFGVTLAKVTLHVGPGTFMPVRVDDVRQHTMEVEYFYIDEQNKELLNESIRKKGRIIAVGTTTLRTLESAVDSSGLINVSHGRTGLFVYPGYNFKIVKNLITNFHLPCSTLFMLVCALGGTDRMKEAYSTAIDHGYRFYSYGDACLILE